MNHPHSRCMPAALEPAHRIGVWSHCALLLISVALAIGAGGGCGGGGGGGGGSGGGSSSSSSSSSGGGGGNQATLELSTTNVSVSAPANGTAPVGSIQVSIESNISAEFYVEAKYSDNGISSLSSTLNGTSLTININFKDPASLGQGTYDDQIIVSGCSDQACTQQISDSPQTVNVTYQVGPPAATLSSLSPNAVDAGSPAFTLTVNGALFTSAAQVYWNGNALPTTFVSSLELQAQVTAADVASSAQYEVQVITNGVGTNSIPFTVEQMGDSQISSISPSSVLTDSGAFILTVNGGPFSAQSFVQLGGLSRATTLVSPNQLTVQILATDVASPGSLNVFVFNLTNAGYSNSAILTVEPLPAFAFAEVSPTLVYAGGPAFYVTAYGNGFTSQSAVSWNGTNLPTTMVSATTLRAAVTAAQVASPGSVSIAVVNPTNQGGTSAAQTLTIAPQSIDAMSFQMNPSHTADVNFNSASLPAGSLWSVNLNGAASYAIIAGGRVFVTVAASGFNSVLYALDATTGATVWGPIQLSGYADSAYEAGTLFVVNGSANAGQFLTAYDAATGNIEWTTSAPGTWYPAPPLALGGLVYTLNAGAATAFSEAAGNQIWTGVGPGGTSGTLAATADGIYGSGPCTSIALQPAFGTVLWFNNTGCTGGGGDTPVVTGTTLYSPINDRYNGLTFNAETGAQLGTFTLSSMPAINATAAFALNNSALQAVALANNQLQWSFAGDGALTGPPIVVNNWVFIGSSNGNLYAVDATTGNQLWTQNLGAAIQTSIDNTAQIYGGLAAGDGLLVVPSGNSVTAYQLSANP
jgi:outer membrane protein assembly factor BamB